MICVTGAESTVDALRERQRRTADAELQEIRLDLLEDPTVGVEALATVDLDRLIVTCRPVREGGRFEGDERHRVELIRRAVQARVGFVDLEADVDEALEDLIFAEATRGPTRVIRSRHPEPSTGEPSMDTEMARLRELRGHVLKLAIPVRDAAQLSRMVDFGEVRDRPVILIGVGAAGLASRVCYRRFGSAWTYVVESEDVRTAAGQITWDQAKAWRLGYAADPAPLALLGGEQILRSPGPVVYNGLFAAQDVPWVYFPVVTERAGAALSMLARLGLIGASVTMPLKEEIGEHLRERDEASRALGAVNTIWRNDEGDLLGMNTDGKGALSALEAVRPVAGTSALLLGAGGTARAIAWELAKQGVSVALWNRTRRRAEAVVSELAGALDGSSLTTVAAPVDAPCDLVINATKSSLDDVDCGWKELPSLKDSVILDCVMHTGESALLRRAVEQGGTAIDGQEMWLHQGALQASRWLGRSVVARDLRGYLSQHTVA